MKLITHVPSFMLNTKQGCANACIKTKTEDERVALVSVAPVTAAIVLVWRASVKRFRHSCCESVHLSRWSTCVPRGSTAPTEGRSLVCDFQTANHRAHFL
jgi:hypothetical protein